MNEKQARSLITKLVNAAYSAGTEQDSAIKTYWQGRAGEIGDEIVRHLSSSIHSIPKKRGV